MSSPRVLTSRRTTLALTLSAPLALAGCDIDPPSAAPTEVPSTADPLPDEEVVVSARKAILVTAASAQLVAIEHPRLADEINPWLALHAAHLAVLEGPEGSEGSEDDTVEGDVPGPRPALARRRFLGQAVALSGTLADAARQAASGDLARALASMSAAIAQRVAA